MRKKIMAFVFAGALVMALAVPLFGSVGTTQAIVHPGVPICVGWNASGHAAGGAAAAGKVPLVGGTPRPATVAQGATNSGANSPPAPVPGFPPCAPSRARSCGGGQAVPPAPRHTNEPEREEASNT